MKVAIIGAGFTGLSAGYYLSKKGVKVTIFEKGAAPGGLAAGFTNARWTWPLEKHYHHVFKSDQDILDFAKEVRVKINFHKSQTSILIQPGIYPLDSALSLLKLPGLDIISKLRTGLTLGYLKLTPFWKPLESQTAKFFILKSMGLKSWRLLWEPLFIGKFGKYAAQIPASWFWARINKRGVALGYPEGGFDTLAKAAAQKIVSLGGEIIYHTEVNSSLKKFDKVITTVPEQKLPGLGAITLVIRLSKPFLPKNTYWLNIGLSGFPFLSVVEHTNLIPSINYNHEHLVYVGNYLTTDHKYFSLTKEELLKEYDKNLTQICPGYKNSAIGLEIFKTAFAQPVVPLNYSKILPPIKTNVKGLYRASMEQVYPFDRGTNYAVKLGKKVADMIINND